MAYKGKYTPDNPDKYVGDPTKMWYGEGRVEGSSFVSGWGRYQDQVGRDVPLQVSSRTSEDVTVLRYIPHDYCSRLQKGWFPRNQPPLYSAKVSSRSIEQSSEHNKNCRG